MSTLNLCKCMDKTVSTQCHVVQNNIHVVIQKGDMSNESQPFNNTGEGMVELGFNLGGMIQCRVDGYSDEQDLLRTNYGQVHVGFYPSCSGVLEYSKEQPVYWLGIYIPVDVFQSFFDVSLQSLMPKNSRMRQNGLVYKHLGTITSSMQVALHQILMCQFLGKTKCLFLEGKILELISHVRFYADRDADEQSNPASLCLTAEDHEKMWQAKLVLDNNLENPPSIIELARQVGVNEFKLKHGFRKVHGITPYKYLAEQRLEVARQLLYERQMNVTEAAFAVGYSSLSHFAKIFRSKFGVNPHEYMASSESTFAAPVGLC